jgi:biotin operon repressor
MPGLQIQNEQSLTTFRLTDAAVATGVRELRERLIAPFVERVKKLADGPGKKLSECANEISAFQQRIAEATQQREKSEANLAAALAAHDEKAIDLAQHAIEVAEQQRRGHNRSLSIWQQALDEARAAGARPIAEQLEAARTRHGDKIQAELNSRVEAALVTLRELGVQIIAHEQAYRSIANLVNASPEAIVQQYTGQALGPEPKTLQEPLRPYSEIQVDGAGHKHVVVKG